VAIVLRDGARLDLAAYLMAVRLTQPSASQAIVRLKALRKGCTLGGLSWKELRDEGRHPKREAMPVGDLSRDPTVRRLRGLARSHPRSP
jgi:hypothetical protein